MREMNPIVHPVVGYLCYAGYTRIRHERQPQGVPTVVAVCAAALPDLIDQPLWLVGITPVGRTFAHSLFGAILIVGVVGFLVHQRHRFDLAVAFAIGYGSHIAADIPWHVLAGDFHELGFLLWPITEMPPYSGVKVVGTIGGVEITTLWFEAVTFVFGVAVWWSDGRPGLDVVTRCRSKN
nr:metal-dependent hydrolase [Halorubrum alkaliphilum]